MMHSASEHLLIELVPDLHVSFGLNLAKVVRCVSRLPLILAAVPKSYWPVLQWMRVPVCALTLIQTVVCLWEPRQKRYQLLAASQQHLTWHDEGLHDWLTTS
jgi:hypothetical protein